MKDYDAERAAGSDSVPDKCGPYYASWAIASQLDTTGYPADLLPSGVPLYDELNEPYSTLYFAVLRESKNPS